MEPKYPCYQLRVTHDLMEALRKAGPATVRNILKQELTAKGFVLQDTVVLQPKLAIQKPPKVVLQTPKPKVVLQKDVAIQVPEPQEDRKTRWAKAAANNIAKAKAEEVRKASLTPIQRQYSN